jgi:hypothetical protein
MKGMQGLASILKISRLKRIPIAFDPLPHDTINTMLKIPTNHGELLVWDIGGRNNVPS